MAYVSHAKKLIVIACPKTGSTSIMASLNKVGGLEVASRHERATSARRRLRGIWDSYEKIGFVREPVDWIDSYYRFLSGPAHPLADVAKFLAWTPTPYNWFTDSDGLVIVDAVYRTEDMAAVMGRYDLPVHHLNKGMNKGVRLALESRHEPQIRRKFAREFRHYDAN